MASIKEGGGPTADYFTAVATHIAAMPKPIAPPLDVTAAAAAKVLLETAPRLFRYSLLSLPNLETAVAFSGPPIDPEWKARLEDPFAETFEPETRRAQN